MRFGRGSDLILALFVVAIVALLLISVPSELLDVLLVINIAVSLLLLLVALYSANALTLFAFPSLLLLTTLFRLSLNVASTRLILLDGYAGEVIQSFGMFLVRGEVVVGILIFSIITVVNFVVITRGSGRVAEVSARFALDALPGKQMAIDSDMRAGLISAEEANRRREELKRESQLYGAMDGAMKFVQGDVIAGIFILFVNIIGGIYLGVSRGLSFADAVQTYTILTIGDGLVTQVPALLVSICAGIIVTRVSSGDHSTLGRDVGSQLFGRPSSLFFAASILLLIGLLPGLPLFAFWAVAVIFVGAGLLSRRSLAVAGMPAQTGMPLLVSSGTTALLQLPGAQPVLVQSPLSISLDAGVLYKLYALNREHYDKWWDEYRQDFFQEYGLELPAITVQTSSDLQPVSYLVAIDSIPVLEGSVMLDSAVVEMNPESAPFMGLEALLYEKHPLTGATVFWAARSPILRSVTDASNIRTYDFLEFLFLKIGAFYLSHPEELITLTVVYSMIDALGKQHPNLVREVVDSKLIDPARLTELLQRLVRERVSVRNLKQILEAVASFHAERVATTGSSESQPYAMEELVSHVRSSRKRQLLAGSLCERRTIKIVTISEKLHQILEESSLGQDINGIDPKLSEDLRRGLASVVDPVRQRGVMPISVLCRAETKPAVLSVCSRVHPGLRVITIGELESGLTLERVGVWSV